MVTLQEIDRSLSAVQGWVERHEYRGYEPFDGLLSWVRPLARGNLFAERLLLCIEVLRQEGLAHLPVNPRCLIGNLLHTLSREAATESLAQNEPNWTESSLLDGVQ